MPKGQRLPSGWETSLLDDVTVRGSGHTPDKAVNDYWNGGIKWVSLADSSRLDAGYIWETDKEISALGLARSSAVLHPPGTVVMSRDAGVGKSAILREAMAVSQHFIAWRCSPELGLHNWFLYYWLQLRKQEFERQAVGSTIKTIGLPYFRRLVISYPPLAEQRRITEILSTWDRAIETVEALIANAREQKAALMQALLTGKRRLPGFGGAWSDLTLGQAVALDQQSLGTSTPQSLRFRYISLSDVERGMISDDLPTLTFADAPSRARRKVQTGDILMATVRPNLQGFARVTPDHADCIASTGFAVLSHRPDFDPSFLFHCLFSQAVTDQIDALVVGSNYPAINAADVRNLKIYAPGLPEQKAVGAVLDNADAEIRARERMLRTFREEKAALMQQLLTGKRRVRLSKSGVA